jgi:hypothetical protein
VYSFRRPSLFQQDLDVSITQRSELVDETNPGEELWIPCDTFFDSGHADEHHAKSALIKDGAQLLQTVYCQTIRFIDDDQGSGVRDRFEPGLELVECVVARRLEGQGMVGPVISVFTMLETPSLVPNAENIERCPLFRTRRSLPNAANKSASGPDVVLYPRRCVDYFRSKEHSVDRLGIRSLSASAPQRLSVPAVQRNDLLDATVMNRE